MRLKLILKTIINHSKQFLGARSFSSGQMACSRYEYVKDFEKDVELLPNTWIVIRVDGKSFHKFSKQHNFDKPNDEKALNLMNFAAVNVMQDFRDIILSYGQSDEYSFIFHKSTDVYNRRSAKLITQVTSLFTSAYVMFWNDFFPETRLQYPPTFDGRAVMYPSDENIRDYLSWRQADSHINNLYNTSFWSLVQKSGLTNREAEERLRGTFSADKNEILFSEFGINYNNEPAIYRKGTILLRKQIRIPETCKTRQLVIPFYEDMIRNEFWKRNDELLEKKQPKFYDIGDSLPFIVEKQLKES